MPLKVKSILHSDMQIGSGSEWKRLVSGMHWEKIVFFSYSNIFYECAVWVCPTKITVNPIWPWHGGTLQQHYCPPHKFPDSNNRVRTKQHVFSFLLSPNHFFPLPKFLSKIWNIAFRYNADFYEILAKGFAPNSSFQPSLLYSV